MPVLAYPTRKTRKGPVMSETTKVAPPAREGTEQTREAAQAAAGSTVRTAKEAMGRGQDVFNRTADEARTIGTTVSDSMARGTEAAADMTQRAAKQTREAMWLGLRTAAGVHSR